MASSQQWRGSSIQSFYQRACISRDKEVSHAATSGVTRVNSCTRYKRKMTKSKINIPSRFDLLQTSGSPRKEILRKIVKDRKKRDIYNQISDYVDSIDKTTKKDWRVGRKKWNEVENIGGQGFANDIVRRSLKGSPNRFPLP